jgi:AcrR family transcriptional regulator
MPPIRIDKPVIATATREFARVGFHGTTGELIAKKAKVTEGSVFRVFGSKENIFACMVDHVCEVLHKSLDNVTHVLDDRKGGKLPEMRTVVPLLMTIFTADAARIIAYTELEQPKLSGRFEKVISAYERAIAKGIEGAVCEDPKVAASQLIGYILHVQTFGPKATRASRQARARRALVENFVEMWLKGLAKAA